MSEEPNPYRTPGFAGPNPEWAKQVSEQNNLPTNEELICLATFESAAEAYLLKNLLEDNGISSSVANEQSAQTIGASLFGRISSIWIEVLVLKSDANAALVIKNEYLSSKTKESPIPEWNCACGETVDQGFGQCWSCMEPYPGAENENAGEEE